MTKLIHQISRYNIYAISKYKLNKLDKCLDPNFHIILNVDLLELNHHQDHGYVNYNVVYIDSHLY